MSLLASFIMFKIFGEKYKAQNSINLISGSKENTHFSEEKQKAKNWFSGAVDLAFIPPSFVESVWIDTMDVYTPESPLAEEFNNYMADNYVCRASSPYSIDISNVYHNIRERLSRTNNTVEWYNYFMSTIFSPHPYIYEFIRRLKDEQESQHHKSEETQVHMRKGKNLYEKIDNELLELIEQLEKRELSPTQLAIKSGKR